MVAEEFYHSNEESTLLQNPYDDEYEEEETLSLCDLPIYSDNSVSAQWGGEFSKDDDFDDFFEFFSEEFTTPSTTLATAEEVIFCGKLIPFKDHHHQHVIPQRTLNKHLGSKRSSSQKGGGGAPPLFLPNSVSSKPASKAVVSDGNKVKLVRSTTKARWFLFMFGMSKLSTTEMQLRDMRNRQSRKMPASMFPVAAPENGKEVKNKRRRSFKGMWKMLTSISLVLGCHSSSQLANDVVKAAFV